MRKKLFIFLSIVLAAVMLAGCGEKEFDVTFDVAGGTPTVETQTIEENGLVEEPVTVTKEGYDFKGWYLGDDQWDFAEDKVTEDITLVAKWEEKDDPIETVMVVFDARGGTPAPDAQEIEKGNKANRPEDPVLAGQTFLGWYLGDDLFDFDSAVNSNISLTARYAETEMVNITFIADGGEPAPDNTAIEKGTKLAEPEVMTRDKHEFLGWFLNDELYNFELEVESDLILIAKWERIYENFTVTFDIGYEGGETIENQIVKEEEFATKPVIEDRIGYRFLGWFDGENEFDFADMILEDLNLVAKWEEEFVVSFDINYAEGEAVASQLILKDEKANEPTIADREFYQFDGWFIDGEATAFDFDTPITGNIHLVGKWTKLDTYNITYHNVTDDMFVYGTKDAMVEAYLLDFYEYINSPFSLSDFMHGPGKTEGYDGLWVEDNAKIYSGEEPDLDNPNNLFFAYHEDYQAKWKPFHDMMEEFVVAVNETQFFYGAGTWTGLIRLREYIIGLEDRAPHIEMMPDPLVKAEPIKEHLGDTTIELPEPYRADATFLGWYDNAEFTGEPITVIAEGTTNDLDLYAKWDETAKYNVTFDIGYAEGTSPAAQEILEGNKAEEPAAPDRRAGYRFQGWYLGEEVDPFDFETAITADITLVAKWNAVDEAKVTLDYATDGVENVVEWVIVDSTMSEPETPVKENHRFLGWFAAEATEEFDFTTPITEDTVLTAKWELLDVYTITYNVGDGELFAGFATREAMLEAFFTDFYNFLVAEGELNDTEVSVTDFIHGSGKTEGFDGMYIGSTAEEDTHVFQKLYEVVDGVGTREVAPENGTFISQSEYNAKWLPLMDLMEEYTNLGDQSFWNSKFNAYRRVKPFAQGKNLWLNKAEEAAIILATIPNEYVVPRHEYNTDDETFFLPQATHPTLDFNGWYDNADLTGEAIVKVEKGSTGNLEFFADFGEPLERYEVQYKLGYEEQKLDPKMVVEGNKVVKPEDPVRHLFEFSGWVLEGETELFDFENTIIDGNIVLVATWDELAPMTVSYDLGYEGAPAMDDVVVGEGTTVSRPETDPERDEFVFLGWYLGETLYDFETPVTANITLVAKWEEAPFTLIYNLVDGNLSAQDMIAFRNSEKAVATKYTTAIGWDGEIIYIGPDTGGTYWYKMGFKETVVPGVYELVGKGTGYSNSEATIYVAYHDDITSSYKTAIQALYNSVVPGDLLAVPALPESYSSDTAVEIYFMADQDAHQGTLKLELSDSPVLITPIREGFNFVGWYDNAELTGEALTEVPPLLEDDLNLYPKWEAKVYHMVTFDTDGGNVIDPLEVETGHAAVEPAEPTKEGFVFLGWNLGTEAYDFATLVTADITLVAQWRALEEYTVTFKEDAEDLDPLVVNVLENAKVTQPADPVKAGHVFDGWFLGEAVDAFDFDTAITGNIVLVAKWTATETVTVSFDLNYLEAPVMDDVVIAKGTAVTEPTEPIRVQYLFLGWFVPLATEAYDFNLDVNADLTLEARWLLIEDYTVTYELDGGNFLGDYADKEAMTNAFLEDFYAYLGLTSDMVEFKHGVGNTAGFDGTWHSAHKAKLYAGPRPSEVNEAFFISSAAYMQKWLPLFDTIDEAVIAINDTQYLWGSSTWTGLIRFREYIINDPVREQHNMLPEEYFPVKTYQNISDDITLVNPVKDGFDFVGWYDNSEFTGSPVTMIAKADTGNKTFYAKWEAQPEVYTVSLDLGYEGKALDPMMVTEGNLVTRPTDPTREFYTFLGWVLQGETVLFDFDSVVIADNITLVATWELNDVLVHYDFGEYGYVSDQTKLDIFTDFATDYKEFYGRTGTTVPELVAEFAAKSYIPGDIQDIFQPAYKEGKWTWLSDYILDVATDTAYSDLDKLTAWNQSSWRANIEAFFNDKQFVFSNDFPSMDFTLLEAANGFWRHLSYNKATEALSTAVLIDGSAITNWNLNYKFAGWYDNAEFTGTEVTALPENSETNIDLYAKWELLPTIAEITAEATGTDVEFVGVVTGFTADNDKAWIEDSTGAITLYRIDNAANLVVGGKYRISGKMAEYNGLIQIANGSFQLISEGNPLIEADTIIDVDDLTAVYQGKRVNLEGTVVSVSSNGQTLVVAVGGKNITLRAKSYEETDVVNAHMLTAIEGQIVNINNIHVDWFDGVQLLPTAVDQVVFTPLTDAEKLQRAQTELTTIFEGESFTMNTAIELPATSDLGVAITWVMDPVDAITGGKWKVVTADTPVTLTATLTIGSETPVDLTLNVTIVYFDPLAEQTYTEDFSFVTGTESSYSTSIQHTDTNGFAWDLLGRPGGADGFGLGNSADGSYIKVTAAGGISSININIKRMYGNSNVRSVELFVNGVSKGTFNVDVNSDVAQAFTVNNINVAGEVVIELKSTSPGSRGAMDVESFEWTTYTS